MFFAKYDHTPVCAIQMSILNVCCDGNFQITSHFWQHWLWIWSSITFLYFIIWQYS